MTLPLILKYKYTDSIVLANISYVWLPLNLLMANKQDTLSRVIGLIQWHVIPIYDLKKYLMCNNT